MSIDPAPLLRRLGVTAQPPSVPALFQLHRRFVETVPYENVDIVLGRPEGIDPAQSARRLSSGRGGYCYHLNGVFAALLGSLGYHVTRHVAGVQGPNGPPQVSGDHLALAVTVAGDRWIADVGLSDCLHEPLPLRYGRYTQGPLQYHVTESAVSAGGWRVEHDPKGSFRAMDVTAAAAQLPDFEAMHRQLSGDPGSPFVRTLCVARRHEQGADVLRSLTLAAVREQVTRVVLQRRSDWFAAVGDVFGLSLDYLTAADQDELWRRVNRQHEDFLAARAARAAGAPRADTDYTRQRPGPRR